MSESTPKERPLRPEERVHRPRRGRAGGVAMLLIVVVVLVILVIGISAWGLFLRPATDILAGRHVQLAIPDGTSSADIARDLADAGVVQNANMFRLQVRLAGADSDLKAGVYDLQTGLSYDEAIEELTNGPRIVYTQVTIPEGYVIEQIAARMEEQVGIPAEEFSQLALSGATTEFSDRPYLASGHEGSLEGYLFPKTYSIREGSTARDVIEMMLDQYELEIASVDTTAAQEAGISMHELVTIASMIEREARVSEERELISSVISNRLVKGMRLEIDATIEYILPGNTFRLRNSDLEIDSPYNTYMYGGLPPGPISNPGLASLQAAAAPAETDFIYYVLTDKDGSHTFATNYEDFQAAKKKSKEVFGR